MTQTVCVYCGSQPGKNPKYEQSAITLGTMIAQQGFRLVYGGGSIGLMGSLARSVLHHGGEVIGIIPKALLECEIGLVEASELIVTNTMRERKALMDEHSHAFMVLPGGFGTLEEMMETLTLRQLAYHYKPIIIINLDGYYDPLFALFDHLVEHGFVSPLQRSLYHIVTSVEEGMQLLKDHDSHTTATTDQTTEIKKKVMA